MFYTVIVCACVCVYVCVCVCVRKSHKDDSPLCGIHECIALNDNSEGMYVCWYVHFPPFCMCLFSLLFFYTEAEFIVPSFNGRSFIEVPRIQKARTDLSIEVAFQTLNTDGIILFNAQNPDGTGDFVSLAVREGYVEFRSGFGVSSLSSSSSAFPAISLLFTNFGWDFCVCDWFFTQYW